MKSSEEKSSGKVQLQRVKSGVAVLTLGSEDEKAVVLTTERMASLKEALDQLRNDVPQGLIITGPSESMFTVGADLKAIEGLTDPVVAEELAKEGQEIFSMIEALPCTTVAAISGPCVGGGCEMALACNYRLITDESNSSIGLPEVRLGILPGFGGTQRLPRLIGLTKALDMILAGKTFKPKRALKAGLVNEIVRYEKLMSRAEALRSGDLNRRVEG